MKKNQLFSILFLLLTTAVFGQNDCSPLKSENEKLTTDLANKKTTIANQVENIQKLEKDINYYKETLKLLKSKPLVERNNIIYHINSVTGKSDEGKIIVKGVIENKGVFLNQHFSGRIELIDPKGNKIKIKSSLFGGQTSLTNFHKDVPVNFEMVFQDILEEMPMIKGLSWPIGGKNRGVILFKNLEVTWE